MYEYLHLAITVFRWVVEKPVVLVGVSPSLSSSMMVQAVLDVVGDEILTKIYLVGGEEAPDLLAKANLFDKLSLSLPHRA